MKSRLNLALLNTGLLLLVLGVSTVVANARSNASIDIVRGNITANSTSIVRATHIDGIVIGHGDEVARKVIAEDEIENVDRHANTVIAYRAVNATAIDEVLAPIVSVKINTAGILSAKSGILHPIDDVPSIQHRLNPAIRILLER